MTFPFTRLRRLRKSESIRCMLRETIVESRNLIAPVFVVPGSGVKKEISTLPNQFHLSVDRITEHVARLYEMGIKSVLLFGVPVEKDEIGSSACQDDGIVQRAVEELKRLLPEVCVVTDLCFCEYTSHGHCGVIKDGDVDNDATLEMLTEQALSHARAGADWIAPSGMMDGMVAAIRDALDENSFENTAIMSYSAKFASAFYGPFREAVQSAPEFGDRRTYQMDPSNLNEALREVALDIEEGADIVMVKPALAFLDVVHAIKEQFAIPIAAYNVSGEYAMVKAASAKGWIDGTRVMCECLTSIRRAGADLIITYFAEEFASLEKSGQLPKW